MEYMNLLYLLLLFFFSLSAENINGKVRFHKFDVTSQLPSSVCGSNGFKEGPSTLEIVHKNGPCAHHQSSDSGKTNNFQPSLPDILYRDRLRLNYIQSTHDSSKANYTVLPAETTKATDYIVRIGIGTPTKYVHLSFDTGSHLTWTQCTPCNHHCYQQEDPIFDPRGSSSYSNISCTDPQCVFSTSSIFGCYNNITCFYNITYATMLYSTGFVGHEKLTLTPIDVFSNFLFGCSHNSEGDLGPAATGILGLGRGPLSFVSQTAEKYKSYFSHCLPSITSKNGYLTFGKSDAEKKVVKFTPFVDHKGWTVLYFIEITSITMANVQLQIPPLVLTKSETIIDSGTTFTFLPPKAYVVMRNKFRRHMETNGIKHFRIASVLGDELDTCFHIDECKNITIPAVSFTFKGNVKVNLDRSGIIYVVNRTLACFAFAGNELESDYTVFGATQQRTLDVVYDVGNNRLGFGSGGCD